MGEWVGGRASARMCVTDRQSKRVEEPEASLA